MGPKLNMNSSGCEMMMTMITINILMMAKTTTATATTLSQLYLDQLLGVLGHDCGVG